MFRLGFYSFHHNPFKASPSLIDPNNLPWGTPAPETRAPVDSDKTLGAYLGIDPNANQIQLASLELAPGLLSAAAWDAAKNLPLVADRSESVEVTFTPEIKALAESLHNNAVEIYTWVHNNIRFIPSHGSIQGAQHTLETKQGNAMDTASLLIALLRAAKIPARYAYGTVQVPVDEVKNWVGGAETPEAAMNLMSIGGIPITLIKMDGKPHSFRFEHVWVEAWVDYLPNRGTKDTKLGADLQEIKTNSGDTWIPMDASYKQYEYTPGMSLQEGVPFDAQALVNNIQTKATVNEAEGWVQNVPQADIEQQLTQFQNQLKTYIENQNPNAAIEDALGIQRITVLPARPLAAGLPYSRIVTSQTFSEVPDRLRHKFKYSLAQVVDGFVSNAAFTIQEPTAKLAGKTLAVSFKPATKTDEDIIVSQFPVADADGNVDLNALPTILPGYLINLTAQFTINGQVAAQANVGTMGGELNEELGLWSPKSNWEMAVNKPTAGEYRAIAVDLQGTNPQQAVRLKQKVDATRMKLKSAQQAQLAMLTKHDLVGDLLYGTVFNYFALNDLYDKIAAQTANVITYRLPSYGIFSTNLKTQYWYNIPRNVEFGGLSMDIDHFKYHHISKDNSNDKKLSFSQSIGARMSAMEHLVPEQMFSTDTQKAHGISAVKAIAIASQEGQKIWTINSSNLDLALSRINLGVDTETSIRNNVNAGKVVTTHTAKINFNGWIGEGYISIDPTTGAGAYQIAGGENGGKLKMGLKRIFGWSAVSGQSSSCVLVSCASASTISESEQDYSDTANNVNEVIDEVTDFIECHKAELVVSLIVIAIVVAAILISWGTPILVLLFLMLAPNALAAYSGDPYGGYTYDEEVDALDLADNLTGYESCALLDQAIETLKNRIKGREANNKEHCGGDAGHKKRVKILEDALAKLEAAKATCI